MYKVVDQLVAIFDVLAWFLIGVLFVLLLLLLLLLLILSLFLIGVLFVFCLFSGTFVGVVVCVVVEVDRGVDLSYVNTEVMISFRPPSSLFLAWGMAD